MNNEGYDYDLNIIEAIKHEYHSQLGLRYKDSAALDKKAAEASIICQQLQIDPAIFIAAQIKFVEPPRGWKYILPNQLCSCAVENIGKFRSIVNRGNTWAGTYAIQKERLAGILSRVNRTIEEILLDHNYDFDPWFRCLITKEPIPSVLKKYGSKARQQLDIPEFKTFLDGLAITEKVTFDLKRISEYRL